MSFCTNTTLNSPQDAMRLQIEYRRFVMVAAICLVTATWSSASSAASCGNYLFRNGKPVHDSRSLMNDHQDAANPESETNKTGNLPAPPCHGPNCSGNPVPLMPVPVAPTNLVRGFDQAAILESLAQTPTDRCAMEIPRSERGARFVPSSIFRPPTV